MTRFFDVHVHPPVPEFVDGSLAPFLVGIERFSGRSVPRMSVDELAAYYRDRQGRAVLLAWDAQTATRASPLSNRRVAEMVESHPDVFAGFGSVDPLRGAGALAGVHESSRLGLKGLNFHPSIQGFTPSDREYFSLWESAQQLGLVCLFHTGFTAFGAATPGGAGVRQGHARPLLLDEVAAEFPGLQIILACPSWPWQEEAIALALHKSNVYVELSGLPESFDDSLMSAVAGPLRDRTLIGTEFPLVTPDAWLQQWEALEVDPATSRKVLFDNAAGLLGV